uniref:NADH-ubiquinone oxidoreductase chain 2 n=1 Tax=Mimela splendens TaxID=1618301 RepID=A0A8F1N7P9_9SCAR|nr:NADH dehydrogenase subunit 2 [Anomala corpulenta]QWQ49936.1 NADH dehydrogenase subunit 2 [Mimela splendens]WAB65615.1 NADH dehydrogenase subunit 2 [Anomala corpulenta]
MYYKLLFSISLMIGTLITVSSYSWMGMWMGLEINLLSMIPLISDSKNMMASEAALKYFIIQTMASTLLLFSIIMMSMKFMYQMNLITYFNLMFNTSLLIKMGAAPFHFWFPEVMEGLNWLNAIIMLTWQKLSPMVLLTYSNTTPLYLILVILFSMTISGIMGLNQTSLRKILAYSSINHIGWMISSILLIEIIWFYYFIIYSIITINIASMFYKFNLFHVNQLYISMNQNLMFKLFFILNFLSLGGLPPFLGFFPKWLTIQTLIQSNLYAIAFIMILMTLMTLYFYLRITFSTFLLSKTMLSYYTQPKINNNLLMTFNFITLNSLILTTFLFNFL